MPTSISLLADTLTAAGIADETKVYFAVDKTDEVPAPGKTMRFTMAELRTLLSNLTQQTNMTATAHGLTSGSNGKPLSGSVLFVDTNTSHFPTAILNAVPDVNTLRLNYTGDVVTLPNALLEGGASFNVALGRNVWWDASANSGNGLYRQSRQSDATRGTPALLRILATGASTFTALVLPMVATPLRLFTDYMLTGADVTALTCNFIPANTALDGFVFASGIALSTEDVTINWTAGTLTWTSSSPFYSIATAGTRIQGYFEPRT